MFYLGPAEWLRAVIQGFASELKSFSAGVESRSREEAPSLLHSADNFNIWPRIVLRRPVSWKHAAMLPSKQTVFSHDFDFSKRRANYWIGSATAQTD